MKPRVFVSSTYYDIKYIRNDIQQFISEYGFEPVLFENNGIIFKQGESIDESCYREIQNCHIVVLIIGGRYGSQSTIQSGDFVRRYNQFTSITLQEYQTALKCRIPIYTFIDKNVDAEYNTYIKNGLDKCDIKFAFADNINVYNFINEIYNSGMYIFKFENFNDIKSTLKDQWAGLMYQYLLSLRNLAEVRSIRSEIDELHTISQRMDIAIDGLVKKVIGKDNEEINEINRKQQNVEFEKIMKIINTTFCFDFDNIEDNTQVKKILQTLFKHLNNGEEYKDISEISDILEFDSKERADNISQISGFIRSLSEKDYEKFTTFLLNRKHDLNELPF